MRYLSFVLTMPSRNTWNGKWSGDDKLYARVFKIKDKDFETYNLEDISNKDFYHYFNDGWTACIKVEETDLIKAKEIVKKSNGFYGYDWMIHSIIKNRNTTYDKNWTETTYIRIVR